VGLVLWELILMEREARDVLIVLRGLIVPMGENVMLVLRELLHLRLDLLLVILVLLDIMKSEDHNAKFVLKDHFQRKDLVVVVNVLLVLLRCYLVLLSVSNAHREHTIRRLEVLIVSDVRKVSLMINME